MRNGRRTTTGAWLVSMALATTACEPRDEIELELDCYGDEIVDAQLAKHSVQRLYRFDSRTSELSIRGRRTPASRHGVKVA